MTTLGSRLRELARRLLRRSSPLADDFAAASPRMPFTVVVAPLAGDDEGHEAELLCRALDGRPGLACRRSAVAVPEFQPGDPARPTDTTRALRRLFADERADVVIWGATAHDGLHLNLAAANDDGRWAALALAERLLLPGELDDAASALLEAAVLAAIEPATETRRGQRRDLLEEAMRAAKAAVRRPGLSNRQQAAALAAIGQAAATLALTSDEWHQTAADAFQAALRKLSGRERDEVLEAALLGRLAALHAIRAEGSSDEKHLEAAVAAQRAALEALPRAIFPQDWAMAQYRLGLGLYRLDLRCGRTESLKESFSAFQAALQVFTRAEMPGRWAEVMNNLALALQVYGDQMRSPEVLAKAIEACRAALEVRTREADPLGWAATQNTLGAALFLYDKHGEGTEHLDTAAASLRAAAAVYRSLGAQRLAAVAGKNLARVEGLARERRDRRVAEPGWAAKRE